LLKKKLGEGEAHLPSTGEFVGEARPIFFGKAQAHQNSAHFGFDGVAVAGAEFVFDAVVAIGNRGVLRTGVVELRHTVSERFHLHFNGAEIVKYRHALRKHRSAREREAILRKISGGGPLGDGKGAIVEGIHAGEDFHECGLASTVATDEADAVVRRNQPIRVFEEEFVAETFSGAGKLNHGLELSSHKTGMPVPTGVEKNQGSVTTEDTKEGGD